MCSGLHLHSLIVLLYQVLTFPETITCRNFHYWFTSCTSTIACCRGANPGCHLADLLNHLNLPVHQRKRSLLPVLVVLFLISYGLLARLVVEQNRVISYQLNLIRQMLTDSNELSALKHKALHEQKPGATPNQNHSPAQPPHAQVPRKSRPKSDQEARRPKLLPEKPPVPASDAMDERRAQISI